MRWTRRFRLWVMISLIGLASAPGLKAQELVREALASFPHDTLRVEYSHPAVLRSLPDYAALRQRYEGPRLQELEDSFSSLGIQESDVQELMLGWRVAEGEWAFFGLALGRFDARGLANRAADQGLTPFKIGDIQAFCPGSESSANCLVPLGDSLGAFGTRQVLSAMMDVRAGKSAGLGSDNNFVKLVNGAGTKGSIWGVARGPAVADWFRGWIPNQNNLKLDWTEAFKSVESLSYSVDAGSTVQLNVGMNCTTSGSAASLRQVLEGLKLFQQLSWESQYPSTPNPFKDLEVQANGSQVLIELNTPYSSLKAG